MVVTYSTRTDQIKWLLSVGCCRSTCIAFLWTYFTYPSSLGTMQNLDYFGNCNELHHATMKKVEEPVYAGLYVWHTCWRTRTLNTCPLQQSSHSDEFYLEPSCCLVIVISANPLLQTRHLYSYLRLDYCILQFLDLSCDIAEISRMQPSRLVFPTDGSHYHCQELGDVEDHTIPLAVTVIWWQKHYWIPCFTVLQLVLYINILVDWTLLKFVTQWLSNSTGLWHQEHLALSRIFGHLNQQNVLCCFKYCS